MHKNILFKVKVGKLEQWRKWCVSLMENKKIVAATLNEENACRETGVLFEIEEKYFVYGMTEFVGEPKSANVNVKLNTDHIKNRKECLEMVSEGEVLYDVKVDQCL